MLTVLLNMRDWLISLTSTVHWEAWGTIVQATVATAAVLLFAWKLRTGWLIINLSVAVSSERQRYDATSDILAITVNLEKGSTDTVWLRCLQYRVRELAIGTPVGPMAAVPRDHAIVPPFEVADVNRWTLNNGVLDWDEAASGNTLTLSPNEKTHFGASARVENGRVYLIEVAVTGFRPHWEYPGFQWRASAVSLPVP